MKNRLLLTVLVVLISLLQVNCIKIINHFIDEQENALTWKELKGEKVKDESEWYEDFEKRAKNPDYGASEAEKQYFVDADKRPKYRAYKLKDDTTPYENKFRKVIANETKSFESTDCYDMVDNYPRHFHNSETEAPPYCGHRHSTKTLKISKEGVKDSKDKEGEKSKEGGKAKEGEEGKSGKTKITVNDEDDDKDNEKEQQKKDRKPKEDK